MRPSRRTGHKPPTAGPRLVLLLLGGAAAGVFGGLQVASMIDRAGTGGMFGWPPPRPPAQPHGNKATEDDRQIGEAVAAALGADALTDCESLAPQHRAGCRAYVEFHRREQAAPAFPPQLFQ